MLLALMMGAALAVAEPDEAPLQVVKIEPGEVMTFARDGQGERTPAPALKPGDLEMIGVIPALPPEPAMGANSVSRAVEGESIPVPPGKVAFQMVRQGKDSFLLIRNGADKAVRYKLIIAFADRVERTDVCDVFPGQHTYEHWPYAIDWMGVADLEFFPSDGNGRPVCQ